MIKNLKPIIVVLVFLITSLSFGQIKQQSVQSFVNPFQTKATQNSLTVVSPDSIAQKENDLNFQLEKGSLFIDLKKQKLSTNFVTHNFNSLLELDEYFTFLQLSEKTDDLGMHHNNYQQYYKGYPIDGNIIMVHSKNGIANSLNGRLIKFEEVNLLIKISEENAKNIAKDYLNVTNLITDYPVATVITQNLKEESSKAVLAYKVRIDSYSPFEMCYIYVDAINGNIINKVNLFANADTPGTAQTLYSGTQSITCDSYSGGYRLRESGRKIQTYDATYATNLTTSGFTGAIDFTNPSTTWGGVPRLSSFTISTISKNWWYTPFADENPDLYIVIKDASNQVVYVSGYYSDKNPVVNFDNLNILLTNPPYKVEIWDYDVIGNDDFGGSYAISNTSGIQSWSGSGNNGSYLVDIQGNPALDVHWGMEKTYDFYFNVFNRNSYNDSGGIIKQYLNSPLTQLSQGGDPNNAFAMGSPYNIMVYGMGDGIQMSPVVGLDVEGHEFTHMVVNNNGNGGLTYQGESGALNESFADIMGACIEFYSGVNPDWNIGEDVAVSASNLRSMSNPNNPSGLSQQPDTYNGTYWVNPSSSQDNGGVHTNSGVQNHWFYLLSQGGSGINDIGNAYTVSNIGISDARQIAYRNLVTYLTPNATYFDAYYGSLQAAEDLYGNPSTQYSAVREAWYAVGIGNNPNDYCSGTTYLTTPSGTVNDGSGTANYNNNANCKWVIAPAGATQISLTFTYFDTEANYDTVFVYDGPDDTYQLLATWWGNTLPPVLTTSSGTGAMCIKFTSDALINAGGWSANYIAYGNTPSCGGGTVLSSPSGSFNDGSGSGNYGNNQFCYWYIAPPCANKITLSFSSFNTELNYDGLIIYDDLSGTNQIAVLSGTSIPSSVTSSTGVMTVVFVSDFSTTMQGFSANYTSTGSAYCSGTTTLNTSDYGTITDGSGAKDYCNNQDCQWLIQPPQATSITLDFTEFDLEESSTDGQTIYDAVEIYDGTTINAPLLGRFTGSNIPPTLTTSGGSMLIRFYSDLTVNRKGWSAYYTSTQNTYCTGTTTLTAINGTFTDGSGINKYANNSDCSWLIQPPNASSIKLSFSSFNTELNFDGVILYDGTNNTAPIIGQFSGTTIPSTVKSSGGSMYVEFLSDPALRGNGWTANYTSCFAPEKPTSPTGPVDLCKNSPNTNYTTNSTNNAVSYIWDISPGNAGTIAGVSTTAVVDWNNSFTGIAVIRVKGVNNCADEGAFSNSLTVNINALPAIPTITQTGNQLKSSASSGNQWYESGSLIPGAKNQIFVPTQNGNYTVVTTDFNGCSSESQPFNFVITSIQSILSELGLKIFPNPTSGVFIIQSNYDSPIVFRITDILGRQIYKADRIVRGNNEIDASDFSKGVYLLIFEIRDNTHVEKLIIE
jgi:Zn-dependent metalloprotease